MRTKFLTFRLGANYKKLVIYMFCTGLNRGAVLLYLPILISILPVDEYGIFSLTQIASIMLVPLIGLGGATAIMREGAIFTDKAIAYLNSFNKIALSIGLFLIIITYSFDHTKSYWLTFSVLLALIECFHLNVLTWMRSQEKDYHYMAFVMIKIFLFIGVLIILKTNELSLFEVLLIQTICYSFVLLVYLFPLYRWYLFSSYTLTKKEFSPVLMYSLAIIPHGLFQWSLNNSNRFIVKYFYGDYELGIFTIAYNLGMVLMILNSGIALTLPQIMFKNYEVWLVTNKRKVFISYYSFIVIAIFLLLIFVIEADRNYFHFLNNYFGILPLLIGFIAAGLYILGIYYFYGNYLLYHKKTLLLSKQTLLSGIFSIIIGILLVNWIGILGAAISTFISYLFYTTLVIYSAVKLEPVLKKNILKELIFVPVTCFFLVFLSFLQYNYWQSSQ